MSDPEDAEKPIPLDYQSPRRGTSREDRPTLLGKLAKAQPILRRTRKIIRWVSFFVLLAAGAYAVRFMIGYAKMLDQAGK